MDRNYERPIPSGAVSSKAVLMISFFFLALGCATLLLKSNLLTLGIGLLTFFWYNAVYTPLKKVFSLAIIPGSLVGALPPVAGWAADIRRRYFWIKNNFNCFILFLSGRHRISGYCFWFTVKIMTKAAFQHWQMFSRKDNWWTLLFSGSCWLL